MRREGDRQVTNGWSGLEALTGLLWLRALRDQCHHDPLLSGPHSLPLALLAAEVSSAQAVSVPP